jgi:hypothetical protein
MRCLTDQGWQVARLIIRKNDGSSEREMTKQVAITCCGETNLRQAKCR